MTHKYVVSHGFLYAFILKARFSFHNIEVDVIMYVKWNNVLMYNCMRHTQKNLNLFLM